MYDQVRKDLTEAMKSGDKFKLGVIRMLKAALMNEEVALHGNGEGLSDDEVITVVKREVKKRNTSIEEYTKYNKMNVVADLKKEVEIKVEVKAEVKAEVRVEVEVKVEV